MSPQSALVERSVTCLPGETERDRNRTHAEGAAASRAVDWLIFLTCSRTLDLASSIEALEPVAAVDRARVKAMALLPFGAPGMRILAALSDMLMDAPNSEREQESGDEKGGKESSSHPDQGST